MKKRWFILAALGAANAAQSDATLSNVTLYGVFDTAWRNSSNVAPDGGSLQQLGSGLIQGSRWGLRGSDHLGGATSAIFDLQSGFNPGTGASAQQGQLFGRQAWVGLEGGFGKLTFGRQFGLAFDAFGAFDPYGIGNASVISAPQLDLLGARFDQTAKYQKKFGAIKVNLAHSFAQGGGNKGRTIGAGLDYAGGNHTVNTAYQQSSDIEARKSSVLVLGGTWAIGTVKWHAGYARNTRDRGFATCASANAGTPGPSIPAACIDADNPNGINRALSNTNLAPGSPVGDATSNLVLFGATLDVTPQFQLVAAAMQNNTRIAGAPDARHRTLYAVANYFFSKRTDVYFSIDHTATHNFTDGYDSFANGNRPTTGTMLGLHHRF